MTDHEFVRGPSDQSRLDAEAVVRDVHFAFEQSEPQFSGFREDFKIRYDHTLELNTFYFHKDHLGSSSYITNEVGNVTQHMEYLPFGETLVDEHSNSFNSPFKFNGKEFDEETGNYYYGARYYDPKWSIFISVDPLTEKYPGWSSYAYVANNPIKYIDPDGRRIVVPQKGDRALVLSYLNNIYGKDNFSFDSKGVLAFKGSTTGMSRDQRKSLKFMQKAIGMNYDIEIKLSNFTGQEAQLLKAKANAIATEGGALSMITVDQKGNVTGAKILMDPGNLTDVPLYSESYIYQDANGKLITGASSCPSGINCSKAHDVKMQNGKVITAPKSEEATLIHEIAHPIYEGQNPKKVLREENRVRDILNIPQRSSSDPEHH